MVRFGTPCRLLWLAAAVVGCGQTSSNVDGSSTSAAGGAAAGGSAAGGSAAGGPSQDAAPVLDISGTWAMFRFEDPVAVDLSQRGNVLSGRGCCTGLNSASPGIECCGEITSGSIVDQRVQFGFTFSLGGANVYSADVMVSADGRRMLGSFSRSDRMMAWVPLEVVEPGGPAWLSSTDSVLIEAVLAREGTYTLALSDARAAGQVYEPGAAYVLELYRSPVPLIGGDLGPFWAGEMSWDESGQTLVVGPVPVTNPEFPIALELHFADVMLSEVEAEMPSGERYTFSETPD